jgi:hypothetical protein
MWSSKHLLTSLAANMQTKRIEHRGPSTSAGEGVRLIIWVLIALAAPTSSQAKDSVPSGSFESLCPILLPRANSFARECREKARTLNWVFSGVKGSEAVYFDEFKSESHFRLGCTVLNNGTITHLGVYYAINPEEFALGNSAPLYAIQNNGNVEINVGHAQVVLVFIREFVTGAVRPIRYYSAFIKNCEPTVGNNGVSRDSDAIPSGTYCENGRDNRYVSVPSSHSTDAVAAHFACEYFIMDDGSLLIARDAYDKYCVSRDYKRGFLAQACEPQRSKSTATK